MKRWTIVMLGGILSMMLLTNTYATELESYDLPNDGRIVISFSNNELEKDSPVKGAIVNIYYIDENDNMFFSVAGTGNGTSQMVKDTILPRIGSTNKVITDCKSCYESIAKENHWNLKQIKSKTYIDEEGNSLANINALHSSLDLYLSNFRGVSTKHLQEYLDLFCFLKYLNWTTEYTEQVQELRKNICTKNTNIKYSNVCNNYSIIDFNEVYSDYNYQPLNSTT